MGDIRFDVNSMCCDTTAEKFFHHPVVEIFVDTEKRSIYSRSMRTKGIVTHTKPRTALCKNA
jgi:hypothetical protein